MKCVSSKPHSSPLLKQLLLEIKLFDALLTINIVSITSLLVKIKRFTHIE